MNRFSSPRSVLAAAIALGALAAGSAAHARTDVNVSIGLGGVQPVYVQHHQAYVQPQPVYVQPQPVYVRPQPAWYRGYRHASTNPWADDDRDGVWNVYDSNWRYYDPRAAHRAAMQARPGDADGDGVPNRFDRSPHNPTLR